MAQYDNTNSGILSRNDKGDNPKRPDMRGSINIEGKEYWLSGWTREGNKGKFLSLKAELKEKQASPQQQAPQGGVTEMLDDVPW